VSSGKIIPGLGQSVIWRPPGTSKSAGIGLEYIVGVQVRPPSSSAAALEVVALAQSSDILHFRLPNPAELGDIFSPNPAQMEFIFIS
jgi:hypothetical protein